MGSYGGGGQTGSFASSGEGSRRGVMCPVCLSEKPTAVIDRRALPQNKAVSQLFFDKKISRAF